MSVGGPKAGSALAASAVTRAATRSASAPPTGGRAGWIAAAAARASCRLSAADAARGPRLAARRLDPTAAVLNSSSRRRVMRMLVGRTASRSKRVSSRRVQPAVGIGGDASDTSRTPA
jgi:hypothetical protein